MQLKQFYSVFSPDMVGRWWIELAFQNTDTINIEISLIKCNFILTTYSNICKVAVLFVIYFVVPYLAV